MSLIATPTRLAARAACLVPLWFTPAAWSQPAADAQTCPDPAVLTRGLREPLATVRYLADDALEGRLAGSAGERCAGDYIAARMAALGLRGAGAGGSYFQDVPLASALNPH